MAARPRDNATLSRALRCALVAGNRANPSAVGWGKVSMSVCARVHDSSPDDPHLTRPNRDLPQRSGRCAGRAKGSQYVRPAARHFGHSSFGRMQSETARPDASLAQIRTRVLGARRDNLRERPWLSRSRHNCDNIKRHGRIR